MTDLTGLNLVDKSGPWREGYFAMLAAQYPGKMPADPYRRDTPEYAEYLAGIRHASLVLRISEAVEEIRNTKRPLYIDFGNEAACLASRSRSRDSMADNRFTHETDAASGVRCCASGIVTWHRNGPGSPVVPAR